MRFEIIPQLIISQEELLALDSSLKLCRDMDAATAYSEDYDDRPHGCDICPKRGNCSKLHNECVYVIAHTALKEIMDMSVVK